VKVTEIPFNRYVGISEKGDGPLELGESGDLLNHLGTVHASAQFALAEATSGAFLQEGFPELEGKVVPVVRASEIKFRKPANGNLRAQASVSREAAESFIAQFEKKGRGLITVAVDIQDAQGTVTATAKYDWFVQRLEG
jgi:acyl-coenzyme A thioesterase PaaI-like protein